MKRILLGVCGGISAYKSCELVRELQRKGCEVRVVMTKSAQEFVTRLSFEALTRSTVYSDLFGDGAFGTAHIEVARWADAMVVAPATAHTLSRFASGEASDFLSTTFLAFRGPIFLAPAMNTAMWEHPAVQQNLNALKARGAQVLEPVAGDLACGEQGIGKMMEPADIARQLLGAMPSSPLAGVRIVVTAGPTREYLDPVRFISSPSTGKMGTAIAREALRRGAMVALIHGPMVQGTEMIPDSIGVTSAMEMNTAVQRTLPADIFIGAAAVADYRPEQSSEKKLKKDSKAQDLRLVSTPDIISEVVKSGKVRKFVIGFAAETHDIVPYAKLKLESKRLDVIVANEVHRENKGFATDTTSVTILDRFGAQKALSDISKEEVARALCDHLEDLLRSPHATRT